MWELSHILNQMAYLEKSFKTHTRTHKPNLQWHKRCNHYRYNKPISQIQCYFQNHNVIHEMFSLMLNLVWSFHTFFAMYLYITCLWIKQNSRMRHQVQNIIKLRKYFTYQKGEEAAEKKMYTSRRCNILVNPASVQSFPFRWSAVQHEGWHILPPGLLLRSWWMSCLPCCLAILPFILADAGKV